MTTKAKKSDEVEVDDTASMVEGDTPAEDVVTEGADEVNLQPNADYAYGAKRADGEIEGVTVNTDQYSDASFDSVKADFKAAQDAVVKEEEVA